MVNGQKNESEQMSNSSTAHSIAPATWRSFELLQQVIDTFDDPIFVKDLQHRWIAANAAFCAILGRSHDEIIGKSDTDFSLLNRRAFTGLVTTGYSTVAGQMPAMKPRRVPMGR